MEQKLHLYEFLYRGQYVFLAKNRGQVKEYLVSTMGLTAYKAELYLFYRGKVKAKQYPGAINLADTVIPGGEKT